jgi:hypothetical protein
VDLSGAPQRVLEAHSSDQVAQFFVDPRSYSFDERDAPAANRFEARSAAGQSLVSTNRPSDRLKLRRGKEAFEHGSHQPPKTYAGGKPDMARASPNVG